MHTTLDYEVVSLGTFYRDVRNQVEYRTPTQTPFRNISIVLLCQWIAAVDAISQAVTDSHVMLVNTLPHVKPFYVGSVHYDWVLKHELGPLKVVDRALYNKSERAGGCVAVDVGMNDGFFTQLSAAYECQVWSFEVQQGCIAISEKALAQNNFTERVTIVNSPASEKHNQPFQVAHGDVLRCDGAFSIAGQNLDASAVNSTFRNVHKPFKITGYRSIRTAQLDRFFSKGTIIDFLKVDVEGFDPYVLRGAEELFRTHRIRRAVIEISSWFWNRLNKGFEDCFPIYHRIVANYGYRVYCVTEVFGNTDMKTMTRNLNATEFEYQIRKNNCVDWEFYLDDE